MEVRYLPSLDFSLEQELSPTEGALTLPCFPLGVAYVPDTEQVLNIFEPRYRDMYNDILLSGGRRFVVPTAHEDEQGGVRLSEVGVVFYMKDLKEVSEQTNDQVKYVCTHVVIGRVRINRVLNPRAFADRSTYLRVEVEDLQDTDADEERASEEERLMDTVNQVRSLQEKSEASVCFSDLNPPSLNATRGAGFWNLVSFWQSYLMARAQKRKEQFENEIRSAIVKFFEQERADVPRQVNLGDLPQGLQRDVNSLQSQFQEEVQPLMRDQCGPIQEIVQTTSHGDRLALFESILESERKNLEARLAIKSVFKPGPDE